MSTDLHVVIMSVILSSIRGLRVRGSGLLLLLLLLYMLHLLNLLYLLHLRNLRLNWRQGCLWWRVWCRLLG